MALLRKGGTPIKSNAILYSGEVANRGTKSFKLEASVIVSQNYDCGTLNMGIQVEYVR
jgi:hypothetical protein